MIDSVDQVFNDAAMIAEFSIRDTLDKVLEQRRFYAAAVAALVEKMGGEVTLFDRDLLMDRDIILDSVPPHGIKIKVVSRNKLVEEIDEDQMELPLEEVADGE